MEKVPDKILYLICGAPNRGKTSLAKTLVNPEHIFEADQYFTDEHGNYEWNPMKLRQAHGDCQDRCRKAMEEGISKIAVANTNIRHRDRKPYFKMAEEFGYTVFTMVVPKTHDNKNNHHVPEEKIKQMIGHMDFWF